MTKADQLPTIGSAGSSRS